MQTDLLLQSVVGLPGNSVVNKTINPANSNFGQGFDNALKVANQALNKSLGKMQNTMQIAAKKQVKCFRYPIDPGQGTNDSLPEAVDSILFDAVIPYTMSLDAMAFNVKPNAENGLLLVDAPELNFTTVSQLNLATPETMLPANEPGILQSPLVNPALQEIIPTENSPSLMELTKPVSSEAQPGLASGAMAGNPVESTELTPVQGNSAVVEEDGTEENTQNSNHLKHQGKQQTAENPTAQKTYLNQRSVTPAGYEQVGLEETQPNAAPASRAQKSNGAGQSDVTPAKQLITVESEKLHGVKTQAPAMSEGMVETPPSAIDPARIEETVLVDKSMPQKTVSTEDIIEQIVKKIELFSNPKSTAVTIKLEPEFLGRLQINLEVLDDTLIARFSTDNLQVKQLLETGINQLRTQLEASGIRLERAEVNIDLGQQFGGYQHHNASSHQSHQPVPEAAQYSPDSIIRDPGPTETGENQMPDMEFTDGSINYLI